MRAHITACLVRFCLLLSCRLFFFSKVTLTYAGCVSWQGRRERTVQKKQKKNGVRLTMIVAGSRSELRLSPSRGLVRVYRDTGTAHTVNGTIDERGVWRTAGNRRVAPPRDGASYRGVQGALACPAHIVRARDLVIHDRSVVDAATLAHACGVQETTAWQYACSAAERFPICHARLLLWIYTRLLPALDRVDVCGSLRDVMSRLQAPAGPLDGDHDWKCVRNRYAHLRLARILWHAHRSSNDHPYNRA